MQVFFSTVETALLPSSLDLQEQLDSKWNSALELVLSRKAMKMAVTKRLEVYNQQLEQSNRETKRVTRLLTVGATVLVFRDHGVRLKNKWGDRFDGPFVVLSDEGHHTYSVQRIGSDDKPQSEHIDNLVEAPVLLAVVQLLGLEQVGLLDTAKNLIGVEGHAMVIGPSTIQAAQPQKSLKATAHNDIGATKKKYEVEYIAGCGNNKFLIKWRGFDVATWEPVSNLDCPRLVRDFERLTAREKSRLKARTLTSETSNAPLSSICSIHTTSIFLKRDLSEYPTGDIISAICKK